MSLGTILVQRETEKRMIIRSKNVVFMKKSVLAAEKIVAKTDFPLLKDLATEKLVLATEKTVVKIDFSYIIADVEKIDKSIEVVDGVVYFTPISSPMQSTDGEGVMPKSENKLKPNSLSSSKPILVNWVGFSSCPLGPTFFKLNPKPKTLI